MGGYHITAEELETIRLMSNRGCRPSEIARKLGRSINTVIKYASKTATTADNSPTTNGGITEKALVCRVLESNLASADKISYLKHLGLLK